MAWYTEVLQSEEPTKLDLTSWLSGSGSLSQTPSASVPPTYRIDSTVKLSPGAQSMILTPPSIRYIAPIVAGSLAQINRRFEGATR